jgi:hypothetical protein
LRAERWLSECLLLGLGLAENLTERVNLDDARRAIG